MSKTNRSTLLIAILGMASLSSSAWGAGGTRIIAEKGHPTHVAASWPEGVGDIVNDPTRTKGLNSWFSEWPNDVNQYTFAISEMADVNRLVEKLAKVKTGAKHVQLSFLKEPRGLGWVTSLPEGNNAAVVFSIGDQSQIDRWFQNVRKPFGKMEFVDVPVAVPPTLTIFVQNKSIQLDELKIPDGLDVNIGSVPLVFHRFNTIQEKEREAAAAAVKLNGVKIDKSTLDADTQSTLQKIEAFLQKRKESPQSK